MGFESRPTPLTSQALSLTLTFNEAATRRKFDRCLASLNIISSSNDLQIISYTPIIERVSIDRGEEDNSIFRWIRQLGQVTCYFDHETREDRSTQFETRPNYRDVRIIIKCHADTPFFNCLKELEITN